MPERKRASSGGAGRVMQLLGPSTGGIRRHVAALAAGLEERGWSVEVAGPPGVMGELRPLDHEIRVSRDPRAVAGSVRSLRRLTRECGLVHAHGLTAGWLASLVPRRRPLVVTVHNLVLDEVEGRSAPLLRRIEDRLPARAEAVIAISDQVSRRFTGLRGADRIRVIPPVSAPPVQQRPRTEVRAELGVRADQALLVLVGRLHAQKDVGTLLEATAELCRAHSQLRVVVAGEGPERPALERRSAELHLDGIVRFLGARDDAADLMAAADVVVMCSVWESYGFVVAEALALGRPLVATAVGPVPDLVQDGVTGRLVPPADPSALAAAIAELLADPTSAEALGSAGARRLRTKLDPGALVDRVASLYTDVLEDR